MQIAMEMQIVTKTLTCSMIFAFIHVEMLINGAPIASTNYGDVEGFTDEVALPEFGNITKFISIPYAKPPINELRFKKPVPMDSWNGTFNATELGHACMIRGDPDTAIYNTTLVSGGKVTQSEDCLVLNIFIPGSHNGLMNTTLKKSVMIYIHGGSYLHHHSYIYDATLLAINQDVIVVTFNYRMGIFGFATTMDGSITSNLALFDQHAALVWVRENIEYFGGDSHKITIFGESAGGDAVINHLASPLSDGLFQRYIAQSAYNYRKFSKIEQATMLKNIAQSNWGCHPENIYSCLMNLTASQLNNPISSEEQSFYDAQQVVIDGEFLPDYPLKMLNEGRYNKSIELIIGFTGHDSDVVFGSDFYSHLVEGGIANHSVAMSYIKSYWILLTGNPWDDSLGAQTMLDIIFTTYFAHTSTPMDIVEAFIKLFNHYAFGIVAFDIADSFAKHQGKVFLYQFDYRSPHYNFHPFVQSEMTLLAAHGEDVSYLFGLWLYYGQFLGDNEQLMSYLFMNTWGEFAKTGSPRYFVNLQGEIADWQPYTLENPVYFHIEAPLTNLSGSALVPNELGAYTKMFLSTLPRLQRIIATAVSCENDEENPHDHDDDESSCEQQVNAGENMGQNVNIRFYIILSILFLL